MGGRGIWRRKENMRENKRGGEEGGYEEVERSRNRRKRKEDGRVREE